MDYETMASCLAREIRARGDAIHQLTDRLQDRDRKIDDLTDLIIALVEHAILHPKGKHRVGKLLAKARKLVPDLRPPSKNPIDDVMPSRTN